MASWHRTHCGRMDHGGCSLWVRVEDNRITSLQGDPGGSLSRGYICAKAFAAPEKLDHPDRLRQPLIKTKGRGRGKWRTASWDQALDTIAENLGRCRERHGADSVAFGQGMPKGLEHFSLIRLANAFGSANVVAVQDVCHAPREITARHTCGFYPVVDYTEPSELVLLWGSNPTATNEEGAISGPLLRQLKRGTKLVVVDPRRTPLAERADVWLQPRPGSDCALALSFLHVLFDEGLQDEAFVRDWTVGAKELEERVRDFSPESAASATWVPPEQVRKAARLYAGAKPAALGWGNPVEQTSQAFSAIRSLVCLMALTGNLDLPGGNRQPVEPPVRKPADFVRADLLPRKSSHMLNAYYGTAPGLMTVPSAFFRRAVLEGDPYPVRAAYMQGTNPLLSHADSIRTHRALASLDFLAVSDIYLTPTAALADVVLPAATQFEFDDIGHYGLGHGYVLARPKVVDPPQQCLPDLEIANRLGPRISSPDAWFGHWSGMLEHLLAPAGMGYPDLCREGILRGENRSRKYLEQGFKTPSGKVELRLSRADKLGVPDLPEFQGVLQDGHGRYPLVLTCSKSPNYLHSSYRWVPRLRKREPDPVVVIHPQTAEEHDIAEGEWVVIETWRGRIEQKAKIRDRILPGVVHAAYGWWFPEAGDERLHNWNGSNYNVLTSGDRRGREFGTPDLKGLACRIERKSLHSGQGVKG